MSDRLQEAFEDLMDRMEEPPTWAELTAHELRPTSPTRAGRRWMALSAGVAAVAVLGVLGALVVGEGRLAAETIPYVRIDWTQEVEMRCQGMDIEDNGGFDSATIEIWGPTSDNFYRLDATAPDGTVERQIIEMGADDRPVRAWFHAPRSDSEEDSVFRVTHCRESSPGVNSSYSMAQAPLFPMVLLHQEFIHLSTAWAPQGGSPSDLEETLADSYDDRRLDEWRGEQVTVFSRSNSGVDELGSFTRHSELWVDLENRRVERNFVEVDSEVLGYQSVTREVTDRAQVPPGSVSFDPAGLHEIFDRSHAEDQDQEIVTTSSIAPMGQPMMENAVEIAAEDLPTPELREAISSETGDQLFRAPVDGFEVLVRLRAGNRPHIYATSCDELAGGNLPDGWDGTCLERTINGERETGTYPYGTTSE